MFFDASAMISILTQEDDWERLEAKAEKAPSKATSALALYEATLGIVRKLGCSIGEAQRSVDEFLRMAGMTVIAIDAATGQEAIMAHARFGKGRHKAALNMGDCFAYACAKINRMPLLCKGDDFIHTDIEIA